MGKKLSKKAEEKTEPPRDDRPSTSGQTSRQTNGFDDVIIKVADAISEDCDLRRLGLELGVQTSNINRALETNWAGGRKTSNGNVMMLQNWAETVKPSNQLQTLRAALKKVDLLEVEETCFTSICSGDDEPMPSDIMKLREQLKSRYRKKFGQIKTSPVDPESRTWLQHIYVSLVLMLGVAGDKEKPIDYDGLFEFIKTDTPKGFVTRLAFIGEAGVGKSTLFAKIALDWAEGKILQEINLLFLESFREITESAFFGDTVMDHFPDDAEVKGEWVDEYIRKNQRKVLILLDGLDEAQIDIKKPNRNDAIVSIVRGERFIDTPVVITTRPFGADQIKSNMTINENYTFGKVIGFTKENMATYIKNYFKDDSDSASTLINFIDTNQVVSEYMAPFPIFCSMLCSLWKTPCGRENIRKMETFSQLLKRLVFSLQEQYFSKPNELEEGYESRMKKACESMKDIGCIAFQGLLVKQLNFDEKALDSCTEAAMTACEVGVISKETRSAPLQIRESQRKQFIQEFSFPHKLLQEYIASVYLASLFHEDRQEFNRILADTLLEGYEEFRYVLYFTTAHGGEVGKSVLEALCKEVDDQGFIIQCAFECHDVEAIDSVRNLLKTKTDLTLPSSRSIAAFLFTLEPIGKEVVRRNSSIRERLGVSESFEANASSSDVAAAAVGLLTLQNLRELGIQTEHLDEKFYTGMSAAAPQSMIEKLKHADAVLGSHASSHYARGLCSMPNLRSLHLDDVKLSDKFYSTMASLASKSKIEELTQRAADLGSAASSHYARGLCSMPNLRSLGLDSVKLSDEFYSTMASEASTSKIEKLKHADAVLGSHASSHYARGLCSMPNLRSLHLDDVKLSDKFYSTMASKASKLKIEELTQSAADLGSAASSHFARGLFSMPNLRILDLSGVELSDKFYSTMASKASKLKIENLWYSKAVLGSHASSHFARGLCTMPNLRLLWLSNAELSDKFYSTMSSEASKSKIEMILHMHAHLDSHASSHYARGLCSMPNLRSLNMRYVDLSDEFYSTMASEASKSKIEDLTISNIYLCSAASSHYARAIYSMPNLRSLHLDNVELRDEFYSTMASEASKSKIEVLAVFLGYYDEGSATSSHFARGLCFMPNLRSLDLHSIGLSDEFYSTMAREASKSKIQTLSMKDFSIAPCRLHSILSLPRLQSLSLTDIKRVDMDDEETLTRQIASVDELSVDGNHVASLWNLGLHTSCPRVKTLKLDWSKHENVSSDIVTMACSTFHHLTHLHIQGPALNDPVSFCKAVITSCPRLTKLSFKDIRLYNKKSAEIIQLMKTRPHLTNIDLDSCGTNADLDPLISEVNSEGKLTVTVKQ